MNIAGIITFNPDIERLTFNLNEISKQVNEVIIIDNASKNVSQIEKLIKNYSKIKIMKNEKNEGVAKALNQIVKYAYENKYKWVLTLDQDSVVKKGLIKEYEKYINVKKVAIMNCKIQDRNFEIAKQEEETQKYIEKKSVITSGSYINVDACYEVGGFDEKMFIDRVDTDMCYMLCNKGYKIIEVNYEGLLHEVGNKTKIKRILGQDVVVFNHIPFRSYYIIRNGLYFFRKHYQQIENKHKFYFSIYRRIAVFIFCEDYKIKKLFVSIKALIVGHFMRVNKKKYLVKE